MLQIELWSQVEPRPCMVEVLASHVHCACSSMLVSACVCLFQKRSIGQLDNCNTVAQRLLATTSAKPYISLQMSGCAQCKSWKTCAHLAGASHRAAAPGAAFTEHQNANEQEQHAQGNSSAQASAVPASSSQQPPPTLLDSPDRNAHGHANGPDSPTVVLPDANTDANDVDGDDDDDDEFCAAFDSKQVEQLAAALLQGTTTRGTNNGSTHLQQRPRAQSAKGCRAAGTALRALVQLRPQSAQAKLQHAESADHTASHSDGAGRASAADAWLVGIDDSPVVHDAGTDAAQGAHMAETQAEHHGGSPSCAQHGCAQSPERHAADAQPAPSCSPPKHSSSCAGAASKPAAACVEHSQQLTTQPSAFAGSAADLQSNHVVMQSVLADKQDCEQPVLAGEQPNVQDARQQAGRHGMHQDAVPSDSSNQQQAIMAAGNTDGPAAQCFAADGLAQAPCECADIHLCSSSAAAAADTIQHNRPLSADQNTPVQSGHSNADRSQRDGLPAIAQPSSQHHGHQSAVGGADQPGIQCHRNVAAELHTHVPQLALDLATGTAVLRCGPLCLIA